MVSESGTDEEEERRLFYVGMTRAREELIVSDGGKPSNFISELPDEVQREKASERPLGKQISLFPF